MHRLHRGASVSFSHPSIFITKGIASCWQNDGIESRLRAIPRSVIVRHIGESS
jgi:hypothetical protein